MEERVAAMACLRALCWNATLKKCAYVQQLRAEVLRIR